MCLIRCAVIDANGMAIMNQTAEAPLFVPNVLSKGRTTTKRLAITLLSVNCKSSHPTYSKECSVWKDEKEILSIKFKDNVTFLEARKTVEKRRSDQALLGKSTTYANVVSPLPTNGHCPTYELLAKKLLQKFPEMTDELKALIPNVQVTTPSTQTTLASETNKPSSAPSKPTNSQSIALQKTSNPSTSL